MEAYVQPFELVCHAENDIANLLNNSRAMLEVTL